MFYFPNTLSGGRIRNLVVMGFFLIGWGTLGSSTVGASAPNMILIMADDMSWRDCSPFYGQPGGHPLAGEEGAMPPGLTPNMRTLVAQGMRFDACFNATAMCAPTRQQLFTGKYPVRSGAYPNHGEVKPETKSIVHHLRHAGYRVGLMGKRHIGPLVWSNAQPSSSEGPFPFEFIGSGTDTENLDNIAAVEAFMDRNPDQPFCPTGHGIMGISWLTIRLCPCRLIASTPLSFGPATTSILARWWLLMPRSVTGWAKLAGWQTLII